MATLNLTDQVTNASQIQTEINFLKTLLNQRKPFWDRMSIEKKRIWIKSNKDPVMTLAWEVFKYLKNNFFREEDTNG